MGVLTSEARAWAETEFPPYEFVVGRTDIARFARATGETDPIHFDPEAARAAGHTDVVAPTMFPYVIRMHASSLEGEITEDGSPGGDVPPLPTTRAMAGETEISFGPPIVAGDTITVTKRVADLYEKEGRSGALVFVEMEFTFTNQRDEMVAREVFTRIYR
ncbi:MAG TPA: MaoC family dehydratase N-terminal domain-containing protein [Acidimicrobiia bacterium]|nr:MaoC family dehydratase N-terminal domain-containing protein [Acidimicrobiia bacterium]